MSDHSVPILLNHDYTRPIGVFEAGIVTFLPEHRPTRDEFLALFPGAGMRVLEKFVDQAGVERLGTVEVIEFSLTPPIASAHQREHWLNGWPRIGTSVLIGTGVHCAGCGVSHGVTCVAFEEDWQPPEKMPDWPFEEDSCPICELIAHRGDVPRVPTLAERLAAFKAAKQRASGQEEVK